MFHFYLTPDKWFRRITVSKFMCTYKSNYFIFKFFKLTIMKINFLLIVLIIATVSSCSTSYKTGQTPDDVYYSPARLQNNDVRKEREETNTVDNSVYNSWEDRVIRRRVNNRRYRRYDDRYNYPMDMSILMDIIILTIIIRFM